ncbi:hypothetical protein ALC56_03768 [Trachymyrmex septentrionalis]|uniref:Uncharacterized protein n=1 Tax=Trachymyrmex septentrionalis TaxID=34720 RepID=A0A195FMZ6_9HYME|nr:hypothetical protein ALC56_03768 [Trachymyrmex septentrionalis]
MPVDGGGDGGGDSSGGGGGGGDDGAGGGVAVVVATCNYLLMTHKLAIFSQAAGSLSCTKRKGKKIHRVNGSNVRRRTTVVRISRAVNPRRRLICFAGKRRRSLKIEKINRVDTYTTRSKTESERERERTTNCDLAGTKSLNGIFGVRKRVIFDEGGASRGMRELIRILLARDEGAAGTRKGGIQGNAAARYP